MVNTADLCPRGLELYAEWKVWKRKFGASTSKENLHLISVEKSIVLRQYQQHLRDCELCEREKEI
jgi:hypothetical protein